MIAIFLSYLIPLCLVFAGFWDGREIIAIFWMECFIIICYSMFRVFRTIGENIWLELFGLLFWSVVLVSFWALFGSMLYQALFLPGPQEWTVMSEDVGNLTEYLLSNYGWVVVIVLFAIHGAEEVKRYRWSDGYRNLPKDMGMDVVKYLMSLFVLTVCAELFSPYFGPDSWVIVAVLVFARMYYEYTFKDSVPSSSDLPPAKD